MKTYVDFKLEEKSVVRTIKYGQNLYDFVIKPLKVTVSDFGD